MHVQRLIVILFACGLLSAACAGASTSPEEPPSDGPGPSAEPEPSSEPEPSDGPADCDAHTMSDCPEGCVASCVGSCDVCDDCDGPGSCRAP
ncbi:MAG: hypothetical protein AB7S26_07370 [Sandaracinaceae bacterium]